MAESPAEQMKARLEKHRRQHEGSEHLAINNSRFRRFLTLAALATTARFYTRMGVCKPISKHMVVKTGRLVHLSEAAAIQFVAENTSIPVPKIYCSFIRKNQAYIVMERIKGKPMGMAVQTMSAEALERLYAQIKKGFDELRALSPPGMRVENVAGGTIHDSRISQGWPRFGPFATIQEFHLWLRENYEIPAEWPKLMAQEDRQDLVEMVAMQDASCPIPVFTHGDLNPSNLMVDGEKLTGVIDWEFAGWYPNYWEYTSAWIGNLMPSEWRNRVDKFLDKYPEEIKMELTRQKWWAV